MRPFLDKYRVLFWISLLLLAGFLAAGIAAYRMTHDAVQQGITGQALPLASDALRSEIRAQAARAAAAAASVAADGLVREWLLAGEGDSAAAVRYLAELRERHGASSIFLASGRTLNITHSEGAQGRLQEGDPPDAWFFRMRSTTAPYAAGLDIDHDNGNAATLSIHYRVLDGDGGFLGVAGVAMRADSLARLIDSQERHAGRRVYFVDAQRRLLPAGPPGPHAGLELAQAPGLRDIAGALLHGGERQSVLQYEREGAAVYVGARFLPELGWHLLVEQDSTEELRPAHRAFLLILSIGSAVTLAVLALLLLTVNRYYRRLEAMAGSDPLTCLLNRQAFDLIFRQAMLDAERSGRPLSCILFDVDFLRQVNDTHGDIAGDEVLRTLAQIARSMLRESDVLARWGGEEFIVLLKDCPLEQAVGVAEKLRAEIDGHDFSPAVPDRHITVSLGVARHELGEPPSMFLRRADEALYKAKANGRNRLQVARAGGLGGSAAGVSEGAA